jgi:small GTP-binding protein
LHHHFLTVIEIERISDGFGLNLSSLNKIIIKMFDYKCVLMGSSEVGKTSIFNTIFNIKTNQFSSTIGPSSQTKGVKLGYAPINIKLLDTSGDEKYRNISREYFKRSEGVMLVFHLTNRKTFEDLTDWIKNIRSLCYKEVSVLLI